MVQQQRIRSINETLSGTIDGYIQASRTSTADSAASSLDGLLGPLGSVSSGGVDSSTDAMNLKIGLDLKKFGLLMQKYCKATFRGGDLAFASVERMDEDQVARILINLNQGKELALSHATTLGTQIGKERSVRYYRVFCALLGIPEVPDSFTNSYYLHYFAVFMGLVWKKYGGKHFGLAGATVEQMISQIVKWLEIRFGVQVRAFDQVLTEVCKGLKRRGGLGLGVMMLPVVTYVFMQKTLRAKGDPFSLLLADAQTMRFLGLRRISETALTTRHDGGIGRDSRLLLHHCCSYNSHHFSVFWPLTKNGKNLHRHFQKNDDVGGKYGCYEVFVARFQYNENFLATHPAVKRGTLPFFHHNGVALHRSDVESNLHDLCALAFLQEPSKGHLNPSLYRINTHSERKGGSCFYLGYCDKGEAFVRWLGDWSSLSFFVYAKVTAELAAATSAKAHSVLHSFFT